MLTLASALLWLAALFGRDPPTLDAVPSRCVNGTSVTRSDWQPLGHKRGQGMSLFEISLNGINGQVEASKGKVRVEEPGLADADRSRGR
jgi:hypothetical protein